MRTARLCGWTLAALGSAQALAAPAEGDLRAAEPSERRRALRALVDLADPDVPRRDRSLRIRLERMLARDPDASVRGLAAVALARVCGEAAVEPVLDAMGEERDPAAERGLVEACEWLSFEEARRALSEATTEVARPRRAALAAEGLAALPGDRGRLDLLGLLVAAPPWAVDAAACLGLARHRDVRVLEALLPRLRHPDASVRSAARWSLARLTGHDLGTDPAEWEGWWARSREGYAFPEPGRGPAVGPDGEGVDPRETRPGIRDRPTHARFFGIELTGRRVAFVVDFSQSMWGPRRDRAQAELVDAVKGLPPDHTFSVILFNERVWWFRDGPLPARPAQKLDLASYLPEQETKSYTNVYDPLEQALGLLGVGAAARDPAPGVDEIVLLSDGVPNRGKIRDPERILEAVRALNAGRARIHTVSLGDEPTTLLPRLAAENGGRHVAHPFPK